MEDRTMKLSQMEMGLRGGEMNQMCPSLRRPIWGGWPNAAREIA